MTQGSNQFPVNVTPPDITEHQVALSESNFSDQIIRSLTDGGLGIATNDPNGALSINNPKITFGSGSVTLSADSFVDHIGEPAKMYPNFSMSGTVSLQNGGLVFSSSSVNPSNFPSQQANGIASSISQSMTFEITPSQYNTYGENPANLKCIQVQSGQIVLIYDSKGTNNYVAPEYSLCPIGGSGGNSSGGNSSGNGSGTSGNVNGNTTTGASHPVKMSNPLGSGITTLSDFVAQVLNIILKVGVPLIALCIIYSGSLFVLAQGNSEKIEKAKTRILYTFIGAAVLLGAWTLSSVVKGFIDALIK